MESSPATSASSGLKKLDISHLFQFFEHNDSFEPSLILLPETDGFVVDNKETGSEPPNIEQPQTDSTEVQNTCFTEFPPVSLSASEALLIDSVILQTEEDRVLDEIGHERSRLHGLFQLSQEEHGKQLTQTPSPLVGPLVEAMLETDNFMPRTRKGATEKIHSTYPSNLEMSRSWIRRSSLMFGTWGQRAQLVVVENNSDIVLEATQVQNRRITNTVKSSEKAVPVRHRRHMFRWRLLYWRWKRRLPKVDKRCMEN